MLTLSDGRSELWQWDTGRTLAVDADCSQVHFSNKVFGRSIDVDVADGVAIIPDILLQTDKDLIVWAFSGTAENGYTKISKTFKVNRRNKPADYVFTPVEQTTIAEIATIAQSVRDDADAGLFDGAQGPAGPIGPVWPQGPAGADGKDGAPGADGHTPEYGVDYGTPEQISGIARQAAEILQPEVNQIKQDLSNKLQKSPADWEAWTAEEQAAARERIGASKKLGIWEDIATVNITEDASAITVNLDANGNTFSLSDIICEITIPKENPVKQRSIYFGLNISTNFAFSRVALTTNASYISGAITYARIVSGRVICDGAISGPSNTRYQPYYKYAIFNGHGGIEAESFDSVSVFTYSDAFPAGTTIILKGTRT